MASTKWRSKIVPLATAATATLVAGSYLYYGRRQTESKTKSDQLHSAADSVSSVPTKVDEPATALTDSTVDPTVDKPKSHTSTFVVSEGPSQAALTLKSVQVFFRHGARTPLKHIPIEEVVWDKDTLLAHPAHTVYDYVVENIHGGPRPESLLEKRYKKTAFKGGCHGGQMTWLGQEQTYQLGLRLRQDYIEQTKFISDEFDPKDVYLRSTNINRTIHSLRCVMAGLYGAKHLQEKGGVVVKTFPSLEEYLYPSRTCDAFDTFHLNISKFFVPELENFRDSLAKFIGYEVGGKNPKLDMIDWRDNLIARQVHNLQIPDRLLPWVNQVDYYATEIATVAFCGSKRNRETVLGLSIGRLINMVKNNVHKAVNNSEGQPKLYLYSVHDSTLIPVLEVFGAFDGKWPPFASDVRIEVFEGRPKEHWVRLTYNGKPLIPAGSSTPYMTVENFDRLVKPYAFSHDIWALRCKEDIPHIHYPPQLIGPVGDVPEINNNNDQESSLSDKTSVSGM